MRKILWICVLTVLLLIGCEDEVRTEKFGNAVVEYHEEYLAVRFE